MYAVRLAGGLALARRAAALLTPEGSPCRTLCGNTPDSTSEDEIVCDDVAYADDDAGVLYQQCVTCEMTSNYHTDSNDTDVDAMLYNMRYSLAHCIFGIPDNKDIINGPCGTTEACGPFLSSIDYKNLSTTDAEPYGHCDDWPVDDREHLEQCTECLRVQEYYYLSNFVTVLQASCEQKPEPGVSVAVKGDVFSEDYVNVTAPSPEATVNPEWFDNGPLNVAAKAGIVAGGVVLLLIIAGCCIVWRGKRRRRAFLRNYEPGKSGMRPRAKGWPSPLQVGGMKEVSDTPLSQKPLRAWDDSPMSAHSDQPFPRYFSPYSSQFNSPVSATDAQQPQWPVLGASQMLQHQQQQNMTQNIGLALGGDDASSAKGKDKAEVYEMQNVDPHDDDRYSSPSSDQQSYFTHSRTYSGSYRNFGGRRGSGM